MSGRGHGLWRWLGAGSGIAGALRVTIGIRNIHVPLSQARNADEQAVADFFAWVTVNPTFLAAIGALWLARLALLRS